VKNEETHTAIQITQNEQKTKPMFGRLLRPLVWKRSGTILVERERMDNRRKQIMQMRKERGKVKSKKEQKIRK